MGQRGGHLFGLSILGNAGTRNNSDGEDERQYISW